MIFLLLATWFSWNVWNLASTFFQDDVKESSSSFKESSSSSSSDRIMWTVISTVCIVVYARLSAGQNDPDQYAARLNKYLENYGARYEYRHRGKPSEGRCIFE